MAKTEKRTQLITIAVVLAFLAGLQAVAIMGLGTYENLPLFPKLATALGAWGKLLLPKALGVAGLYYGSIPLAMILQAVGGAIIYAIVTPPGPVVRIIIAHVATTLAIIICGAML